MTKLKNQITRVLIQNAYFSSFEEKYLIKDNLDEKNEPVINAGETKYNTEYFIMLVVTKGTLHLIVGNTKLEVKANEYLSIKPCMNIYVEESRCLFYAIVTRSNLMTDIFEHTTLVKLNKMHAFSFSHIHFNQEQADELLHYYQIIKKEHLRENYLMKEMVLRAYVAAFLAKLCSFTKPENYIPHIKSSRQYTFFIQFLEKLSKEHKKERAVQYYANALKITPKYLSSVVQLFTKMSASQVIDQYVVYAIKQSLYSNEQNIKSISQEFHFPSQSFFGRYFKRITGMSPNEYIKRNNRKSLNFIENNKENN